MAETATIMATYAGEEYKLASIPKPNSELVKACKNVILNNLDLSTLVTDLDRASELLFLAYNGVAGFGHLVAGVDEIQNKLLKLLNDSQVTMSGIEAASRDVLNVLAAAFAELLDEEEEIAMAMLARCENIAGKLETASARLANDFNKLAEDTVQVLVKTHQEKGNQRTRAAALKNEIADFEASTIYLTELKSKLAESKEHAEKLYNEAKSKQETEEERAFGLAITEAIFGAIGKGLGAAAAMRSPSYPVPLPADPRPAPAKRRKVTPKEEEPEDDDDDEPEDEDGPEEEDEVDDDDKLVDDDKLDDDKLDDDDKL